MRKQHQHERVSTGIAYFLSSRASEEVRKLARHPLSLFVRLWCLSLSRSLIGKLVGGSEMHVCLTEQKIEEQKMM
jgi:hypothetical protein